MDGSFHGTDPEMDELDADDRNNLEVISKELDIPLWTVDATIGDLFIDAKIKGVFYGQDYLVSAWAFGFDNNYFDFLF